MTMKGKKTVLIMGYRPGGIGYALAKQFHFKGLRVFATARGIKGLADIRTLGIKALQLEVTPPAKY